MTVASLLPQWWHYGNGGSGVHMIVVVDGIAVYVQSDTWPTDHEWSRAMDAAGLTGKSCMLIEYDDSNDGHEWVFALRGTSVAVSA